MTLEPLLLSIGQISVGIQHRNSVRGGIEAVSVLRRAYLCSRQCGREQPPSRDPGHSRCSREVSERREREPSVWVKSRKKKVGERNRVLPTVGEGSVDESSCVITKSLRSSLYGLALCLQTPGPVLSLPVGARSRHTSVSFL